MIVAWDFDGVLNRNTAGGRYVWEDEFLARVGQSVDAFEAFVFADEPPRVIAGEADLLDRLEDWVRAVPCRMEAAAILEFWMELDARPDAEMVALVDALNAAGTRQVIATNNEARRASFIAHEMGFGARMERVFASGPMGIAKPDRAFFDHISRTLDVPPEAILFIDDKPANVGAATDAGWQGFHFTDETRGELIDRLQPGRA